MSVARSITRLGMAAALCSPALYAHGQAVFGSIFGTVQDASGAVVPNATVTVTDAAKGISVTAKSNASGEYTVGHLIPDPYNVKVEALGFQSFETKGINVVVDTSAKVDASLTVGLASQVIEVRSDTIPQLKTDNADVSSSLTAKEIEDLPIPGRNVTGLQLLLPGAQQLGFSHAASENPQGSLQIQVDGQAFGGTAFELDGTDNEDPILGIIVINPNPDSLQQQKIATQNFDAEFGKAVSAVVTEQTKSGANTLHGSAFWYRESAAQLARDPFTQGPSQLVSSPFPQALRNQFGGSLGGPIKRDKAFFFVDYQGLRQKVGTTNLQTVPSANVISTCLGQSVGASGIPGCDFSEYSNPALGNNARVIYDPANGGAPFPGSVVPLARVSPQAQNLFRLLQPYRPNTFTDTTYPGLRSNYAGSGIGSLNSDQWDARVDYQIKENLHSFGRFSRFTDILNGPTLFGAAGGAGFGVGGYGGTSQGANDSLAGGFDLAVNPKLVTDFRIGYYRYNIATQKYDQNVQLANQLGIPGLNTGSFFTSGAPSFQLAEVGQSGNSQALPPTSGGPQYGAGLNVDRCNCPLTEREDQYQIVNNWTRTIGNHELKFGADLRYARNLRVPSDNDRTGVLQFFPGPTSNPAISGAGTNQGGLSFASLALGEVSNFNRYVSTSLNAKEFQKRTFFYAQDTWRPTAKLTVNYGLRYEIYFPEVINNAGQGGLLDLASGYIRVAGVGGVSSGMNYARSSFPFSPRLGVAYQATEKTVIRAGYGRSFDIGIFGSLFGQAATQNLPVLANQQITLPGNQNTFAFNLANGPTAAQPTAVPANGLLPNPGYAVNSRSRPTTVRLPTLDAWNLSVQQAVTPTLSVTFAYVGNKGTHTLSGGDGNSTNPNEPAIFLPAQFSVTGQSLHYDPSVAATVRSPLQNNVAGVSANGGTNNQLLLQRYYGGNLPACSDPAYATPAGFAPGQCGWSNGIIYYGDNQDTHYNALQISLAKQFTKGFSLNANYAWQHATNFASSFSTWDRRVVKGRDDYTREQSFVLYGSAELPFGRNKFFFHNSSGLLNEIVGGWQFTPIITWQSGLPFTLSYNSCPASIPSSAPCYVNGPVRSLKFGATGYPGGPTGVTYYQAQTLGGRFTAAPLDTVGNSGRNSVFGPNYFNGDLSLQKNFPIRENLFAQFRWDAYNGFNHINYGVPGGPDTSATASIENTGSITGGPLPNSSTNPRQQQFSVRLQF